MADLNSYERRVPWHYIGFVTGLALAFGGGLIGTMLAMEGHTKSLYDENRRKELTVQCVEGNENACRIYEVDYKRD